MKILHFRFVGFISLLNKNNLKNSKYLRSELRCARVVNYKEEPYDIFSLYDFLV